jgi:hypothetical protein
MWNDLFLGHRVFVSVICNAGWSGALFASYSQWIVGPFAMIVSQESCVFAMIVGREIPLFASPRVTVRKPLQLAISRLICQQGGDISSRPHAILIPSPRRAGRGGGVGHHLAARMAGTDLAPLDMCCRGTTRRPRASWRHLPPCACPPPTLSCRDPHPRTTSPRRARLPGACLIL